jgi:hypothetical protein
MYYSLSYIQYFTTRKSDNTNGITDGNFPRQFLPTKIIPSQNLSKLTNRKTPAASPTARNFFWKLQRQDDVDFFKRIYQQKYRGIQTRTAKQGRVANTGKIIDGGTDGIFPSVISLVNPSIYCLCRHSLFLCFSFLFPFFFPIPPLPFQTAANHPSQLSPLLNTS